MRARGLANARQLSLKGAGLLEQKNYNEAGPLFSEALKHSPADERAQWGMAEVLWETEDQGQAIQHMSQAAELSGKNPDLVVRLGEMHLKAGNIQEAAAQAERALTINRQHAGAWALKGQVLRMQNQVEDALIAYQRALNHAPEDAATRIAVSEIYQRLGRPQRALATLDYLTDSQPTEAIPARVWLLRGEAYAALGESSHSKYCLQEASSCVTECDTDSLVQLARLQYKAGDLAEARLCVGKALQQNPRNPHALELQTALDQRFQLIKYSQPVE